MLLWASVVTAAASAATLISFGSLPGVGDLAALTFALSLFIVACASEPQN
jgi:hypothetical protein